MFSNLDRTNLWQGIGFLLVSALLLVLAYPPFDQGWVIWVALIPTLLALKVSPELRRRPFASGYIVGLISFGGQFWWIGHVTVPGIVVLVAYIAVYPAIWLWVMERWFGPRCDEGVLGNVRFAFLGACLWVALEWMRGWFLTGFGWNNLGVTLHANIPLIQLASLGGVYMLSWLIVFVNVCAFRTFQRVYGELSAGRPRGPLYELSLALVLTALGFAWGWNRTIVKPPGALRSLRYAAVQANIPQSGSSSGYEFGLSVDETLRRHEELSLRALEKKPDLLIWPEATTGLEIFLDEKLGSLVSKLSRKGEGYFLLGAEDSGPGRMYNAAFLFSPGYSGFTVYHKNRLVIFGEYVPLAKWLPLLRRLVPFGVDFTPGDRPEVLRMPLINVSLAPLICFEDTQPDLVRLASAMGPDILVNLTNDSWFKDSPGAEQHLANAVFRTVENDRPLLRAANTGVTCEVNQYGVVKARVFDFTTHRSVGVSGLLERELRWHSPRPTLYQRFGDWLPLVAAINCLLFSLPRRRSQSESISETKPL